METVTDVGKKAKEPEGDVKAVETWTIMAYLAGDNNLTEEMIYAIKEIYRIGVTKEFDVVIQFDPSAVGSSVRDFVLSQEEDLKRGIVSRFTEDGVVGRFGDPDGNGRPRGGNQQRPAMSVSENSANPETLKNFIVSSITEHKADHYMVILSGHGSGVEGNFLTDIDPDGIERDDVKPPASLSLVGLKWAFYHAIKELRTDGVLGKEQRIDVVGMDSCLMSMAEVGYQLRDLIDYLIGAEGLELNTGWPYHRLLEGFRKGFEHKAAWTDQPGEVAVRIVNNYVTYYEDYELTGGSTDQAACNLRRSEDLRKGVSVLSETLLEELAKELDQEKEAQTAWELRGKKSAKPTLHRFRDAVTVAHWRAQSYNDEQYIDLWDFCNLLAEGRPEEDPIRKSCNTVQNVIENGDDGVVLKSGYNGAAFQHSHGLSIYFPWTENDFLKEPEQGLQALAEVPVPTYEALDFARQTRWVYFLRAFVRATRRERRGQDLKENLNEDGSAKKPLHFDPPKNSLILVRKTFPISRGPEFGIGAMKNPPDGFYRPRSGQKARSGSGQKAIAARK